MSTKYRIKIYNVLTYPRPGYTGCFIAIDDVFMRTVSGGAIVNLITSGTATAHSVWTTYVASYALSGQANFWHSAETTQANMTAGNAWWQYEFTADNVFIKEYTMRTRSDGYWSSDTPKTWALEWYNPATSSWIVIDERTNISWSQNELKTFLVSSFRDYSGRDMLAFNNNYIFKPTISGIEIYNTTPTRLGFISSGNPYFGSLMNVVWANEDYLYIGTSQSGVLRSPMSSIASGIYNNVQTYKSYPDITNNNVLDIYGNGDYLCVATTSGVDELHISTADHYFTTVSGAQRCFQTASGIYYTISGNLHAVYDLNSNWTTPSYTYNSTKHESFVEVNTINDLVVVSGVICVGTNAGVVTIFEARGNERTSPYKIYKIK
jgi:hypothetical protein